MRHAKSSWDDPELADHDRPLAPRGRKAAGRIAKHLKKRGLEPSVVLCTSALRGLQTLELIRPALPPETAVKIEPKLYGTTSKELLTRVRRLSPAAGSVLIVGHNPAIQDLALELAAGSDNEAAIREKFPTAALVVFDAPIDEWRQLAPGEVLLVDFVTAKTLKG
jgi:phosphohistidine phosphatase